MDYIRVNEGFLSVLLGKAGTETEAKIHTINCLRIYLVSSHKYRCSKFRTG